MDVIQWSWRCLLACLCLLGCDVITADNECPKVKITNGAARTKSKGKLIDFRCKKNFELVGDKFAVCTAPGQWSKPTPICVGTTCIMPITEPNLVVQKLYKGGVIKFTCSAGLTRSGPESLTCDGKDWSGQLPICSDVLSLGCDFENDDLCGWSQDTIDDFDWTWNSGTTPTSNTGPLTDHTTNSSSGHYLFMESSAPRRLGERTRLLSPPYLPARMNDMCLEFFYHMFGPDGVGEVGDLDVFLRPLSLNTSLLTTAWNVWHRTGNHGDLWVQANLALPPQRDPFNIVFQATRLKSWTGDIAIDDVRIYKCSDKSSTTVDSTASSTIKVTTPGYDDVDHSDSFPSTTLITPTPGRLSTLVTQSPTNQKTVATSLTDNPSSATTSSRRSTLPKSSSNSGRQLTTKSPLPMTASTRSLNQSQPSKGYPPSYTSRFITKPAPNSSTTFNRYDVVTRSSLKLTTKSINQKTDAGEINSNITDSTNINTDSTYVKCQGNSCAAVETNTEINANSTVADYIDYDSIPPYSESSVDQNKTLDMNGSDTSLGDYEDAGYFSPEDEPLDGLLPDTETSAKHSHSTPTTTALLPLIVGIVASVLVGLTVIAIMAWVWVRSQRRKQEKSHEDQLNIISEYVETSLNA